MSEVKKEPKAGGDESALQAVGPKDGGGRGGARGGGRGGGFQGQGGRGGGRGGSAGPRYSHRCLSFAQFIMFSTFSW